MRPEVGCLGVNAEFVYLVSSSGFLAVLIIMLLVPKRFPQALVMAERDFSKS